MSFWKLSSFKRITWAASRTSSRSRGTWTISASSRPAKTGTRPNSKTKRAQWPKTAAACRRANPMWRSGRWQSQSTSRTNSCFRDLTAGAETKTKAPARQAPIQWSRIEQTPLLVKNFKRYFRSTNQNRKPDNCNNPWLQRMSAPKIHHSPWTLRARACTREMPGTKSSMSSSRGSL